MTTYLTTCQGRLFENDDSDNEKRHKLYVEKLEEEHGQMEERNSNNERPYNSELFYSGPTSCSSRIITTPSGFARSSLLFLQECGELTAIKPHTSSRTNLTSYLFFVVKEGAGWLEYDGERYELGEGDIVFIDCQKGYSQSSSERAWTLKWAHFNSSQMSSIWNKYCERGGKSVFHPGDSSECTSLLDKLYETASSESYIRDVQLNTILSELIGLLFAETIYEENEKPVSTSTGSTAAINVGEIKSYIDTHYQEPLTLESLADHFHFSKHYIARIFKATFGLSVGSYIQLVRIGKSKELLRFTLLTVEQISYECGYGGDSNYFSRVFKKVEGVSPSDFRRNWMSSSEKNTDTEQ